jgi:alcohol dehydrogenase class IV
MPELGVLRPPRTVLLGDGVVEAAGRTVAALGERALICTDPFLAAAPPLRAVTASLRAAGVRHEVFDGTVAELPLPAVEAAVREARALAPDVIVGLGGGSCLDMAKLIALGLSTDAPLSDCYGEHNVPGPTVPVVAIPTTAGTGSEVTPVAVLTDPASELKVGISSPHLVPVAAICDPALTLGAPATVTAFAGIDALAHAVEAYTAVRRPTWADMAQRVFVGRNALSDRWALHAIARVGAGLRGAIDDDPAARALVMEGSLSAGLAFATAGTALAHALQYPIGARTRTPHGLGVGLLLPFVMAYNAPACEARMADVGRALGTDDPARAVRDLALDVGVPGSLAQIGVQAGELEEIATAALGIERLIANNPREVDPAGLTALLRAAHAGDLAPLTPMEAHR